MEMSGHASTVIDQKAYLKKYLSGDTTKKKKHKKDKKHKVKGSDVKVKIIDDDVDAADVGDKIDEELLLVGEDAPQIVGEYIEEHANTNKWRSIAVKEESPDEEKVRIKQESDDSELPGERNASNTCNELSGFRLKIKQEPNRSRSRSLDQSPPRRMHNRKSPSHDHSSPRRKRRDLDQSPPKRKRQDSDQSPPRQKRRDLDQSPPIRKGRELDQSPRKRKGRDSDQSPPRRKGRDSDQSPPRRNRKDSDQSPPRRIRQDESPPGRKRQNFDQSSQKRSRLSASKDQSPPRRHDSSLRSPTRRRSRWEQTTATHSPSPPPTHKPKSEKTLEGKKAGLQDAQSLRAENDERRRQEDRIFTQMSADVSGRDAEVAVRSSGRRGQRARDAAAEDPEVQRRKAEHEQEKRELYDRWGKGLKQIEDHRARMQEQEYEGSKPLARYSNDEDLERHLREQERADDPMLQYIRQKKKDQAIKEKVLSVPVYQGNYPDNRFGIRPGYRWDGVDRSNGYEAKWLSKQNEQLALQDEAYKYMVEDM